MAIGRREFVRDLGIAGIAAAMSSKSNGIFSPLEAQVQPERQNIGKINDGYNNLEIREIYSDGMFLTQTAEFGDYNADILYFIRKEASKDFGEWSVQVNLYKKGQPKPVNTMKVDGSLESGKMVITNTVGPDKKNALESTFTEAAYEQSSMFQLSRPGTEVARYVNYLSPALAPFRKDAKQMPTGYNPLLTKP